jgi:DNA repair protein RadA/Sms
VKRAATTGAGKGGGFARAKPGAERAREALQPVALREIATRRAERIVVEPEEVARVLGGGLVGGSVVLLGGAPGVGKSTLLTGLALGWVRRGVRTLYVAGEESPAQIRLRAERLGFDRDGEEGFHIIDGVELEAVIAALYADRDAHPGPCVVIADSIQTLHSAEIDAWPGSVSQIRYCGGVLADFARTAGSPVFLVGHVTKSGDLAGPKVLEHMVDTVLYFDGDGGGGPLRMVRAVKNRFGATGELAVLEMRGDGLVPVDEAGALFLSGRRGDEPGACVTVVRNGSRMFLTEVQALVSPSRYGTPQRVVQGVDAKRVALLAAILEKRAGVDLAGCDLFVKVAGGAKLDDPAADLAVMTALASSLREIPVPVDTLVLGEVGLTGEVRTVTDRKGRLREASRHGFKRVVAARVSDQTRTEMGLVVEAVKSVGEAVALALGRRGEGVS